MAEESICELRRKLEKMHELLDEIEDKIAKAEQALQENAESKPGKPAFRANS